MLFKVNSTHSIDAIDAELRASATRHSFGVIAVHDLQQTLSNKGVSLAMECRVYEVCNPQQAKKVLEADGALSTALPCRVSVYGSPGSYTLATMLPTAMMQTFNQQGEHPEIASVAREVEAVIVQMMNDAAKA
jgi:uncharacterized protein (DUF302 family)